MFAKSFTPIKVATANSSKPTTDNVATTATDDDPRSASLNMLLLASLEPVPLLAAVMADVAAVIITFPPGAVDSEESVAVAVVIVVVVAVAVAVVAVVVVVAVAVAVVVDAVVVVMVTLLVVVLAVVVVHHWSL